ncbi:hypothetical protein BD413DRAFT_289321 [Trametes elegans]|nr:hypothetical protein BD413DRAFT_289321 [Trametes elegans]
MAQGKPQLYWKQLRSTLKPNTYTGEQSRGRSYSANSQTLPRTSRRRRASVSNPGAVPLLVGELAHMFGKDVGAQAVLLLGQERVLAEERIEEGMVGYNALKQLDASGSDSVKAALVYYAHALRRPSECLDHLLQVEDLSDAQGPVFPSGTTRSAPATLQVPGSSSDTSISSSWTGISCLC